MKSFRLFVSISALAMAFGCSRTSPTSEPMASVAGSTPLAPSVEPAPYDPMLNGKNLAFHRERVERDPKGAIGWAMLSTAYLAAARESDSDAMAVKAEDAARKSLALRTKRNARAAIALAEALLEQHRFAAALAATEQANRIEPSASGERLRAEILLELGRYPEAEDAIRKAGSPNDAPSLRALAARWQELHGKSGEALKSWAMAIQTLEDTAAQSPTGVAWFHTKYGDALARAGRYDDAEGQYERALWLFPRDHRAHSGLARLAAQRGEWSHCVEHAEKSLKIAKLTDTMGMLADAQLAMGEKAAAETTYRQVDERNAQTRAGYDHARSHGHVHKHEHGKQDHTHDRLYAHFLADHGRDLPLAYHAAKEDLELRQDIYAWDTVAWAAFRDGKFEMAEQAVRKATSLGTRDPKLCLHAGLIEAKAGQWERAKAHLEVATQGLLMPRERQWAQEALAEIRSR